MNKVLENSFYYLDNFQWVLDWISARYADLLIDEEARFIADFAALPRASRALFVRMVMRKGHVFRASKLNYAEIGAALDAAQPLLALGWLHADPLLDIEDLFDLLQKPEIVVNFQLTGHQKSARKDAQLAALRDQFADARPFSAWCKELSDTAFQITVKALCDRLRLLFFGNFYQDWSEFVLADLGIYRYEKVAFSASSRGFRSRQDLDHYVALFHCSERFHAGEAPDTILLSLPSRMSDNEWLAGRHDKLQFQLAQQLEKLQDWSRAYATYAACALPGARARAIRVLEKDEQYQAAFDLLDTALAAPESAVERQQLLRIAPRLRRKLGHGKQVTPRPPAAARLDLCLPAPIGEWYGVEELVRAHLHATQTPAYYVENTLINGLFGLLCWDAIYAAIPGAFFHPFHRGPADLHSADFHSRRAREFQRCLEELDDARYLATIRRNFDDKSGMQSPFVAWDVLDSELLELALDCIPAAHLKPAFERILSDIKTNRSGFPDLIQFWPDEQRYNMIEVKGPGDRLQDSQLRWIEHCAMHGMPVTVCYLRWADGDADDET